MTGERASTLELGSLQELSRSGSFEDAIGGLERVVSRLEDGQLSIGDAVQWYETGLALSQRCSGLLKQVELQIRVLEATYDLDRFNDTDESEPREE